MSAHIIVKSEGWNGDHRNLICCERCEEPIWEYLKPVPSKAFELVAIADLRPAEKDITPPQPTDLVACPLCGYEYLVLYAGGSV